MFCSFLQDDVQRAAADIGQRAAVQRSAKIIVADAVQRRTQFGAVGAKQSQGIQIGDQVATHAVLADQLVDAILDSRHPQRLIGQFVATGPAAIHRGIVGGRIATVTRWPLVRIGFYPISPDAGPDQELLEILAPRFRNAVGILNELDIQIVDVVQAVAIHGGRSRPFRHERAGQGSRSLPS